VTVILNIEYIHAIYNIYTNYISDQNLDSKTRLYSTLCIYIFHMNLQLGVGHFLDTHIIIMSSRLKTFECLVSFFLIQIILLCTIDVL